MVEEAESSEYRVGGIGEMRNAEGEGLRVGVLAEAGAELGEGGREVCVLNDVVASVLEHLQQRSTTQEVAEALHAPVVFRHLGDAFHCVLKNEMLC